MSSIIFFFIFIIFLAFVLLALNLLLAPHNPYAAKSGVFECGFSSYLGQNRQEFSISFFIFALLFMLFDLEIILVYPYTVSAYNNSIYGLVIVIIFLVILTAGFVFELGKNALKISSRQSYSLNSIYLAPPASPSASIAKGFNNKLNLNRSSRRFYSTKKEKF
jgi:NADH-ubiquinone oxidoreductase chain 3